METSTVRVERRAAQRFPFHLPVNIKIAGSGIEGCGFTEDISARGAFLYTQSRVAEGSGIELTLNMPSEITLAESMRVRCRGKVLRVVTSSSGDKFGVAVHLEGYEYLPDAAASSQEEGCFGRISSLHGSSLVGTEKAASTWSRSHSATYWKASKAS
jgi:PilZ domain